MSEGIILPTVLAVAKLLIVVTSSVVGAQREACAIDFSTEPILSLRLRLIVGNEMDPSPLCHDEIAQHQTGIEERGPTYEQV